MGVLDLYDVRELEQPILHKESALQGMAGILYSVARKMNGTMSRHFVFHFVNHRRFILHAKSMHSMGAQFCPNRMYFRCSSRNWKKTRCVGLTDEQETVGSWALCTGLFCYSLDKSTDCGNVGRDGEVGEALPTLFISSVDSCSVDR